MADIILCSNEELTDIANAIREKTGSSDLMSITDMPELINGISGGGINTYTCEIYCACSGVSVAFTKYENNTQVPAVINDFGSFSGMVPAGSLVVAGTSGQNPYITSNLSMISDYAYYLRVYSVEDNNSYINIEED